MNYPQDVKIDASGNIYVVDSGNNRIQKFDSAGNYVLQWGGAGTGNSQFNTPDSIAFDSLGNVYVTDTTNNRVQKFDSSGGYITKWGSSGTTNGKFKSPMGIAVRGTSVYVVDSTNNRVQIFDLSGGYLSQWGTGGSANGQFNAPDGIDIDSTGNVFVADVSNERIQKFDSSGVFLTKWGSYGTDGGLFQLPYGLTVDNNNNVYVVEVYGDRLQKFTFDRQAPSVTLTAFLANTNTAHPSLSGSVNDTLSAVTAVQYQVDSTTDSWSSCLANDGAFDKLSESFTCTISSTLTERTHTIYVRATDSFTNTTNASSYTSTSITYDHTAPQITWTDTSGSVKSYQGAGADNVFTTNHFPTFSFTASLDATSGISKYQILVNGNVYIDSINPTAPSNSTYRDETDKYTSYTQDTISVYSKRPQDALPNGAYQWKVRAIDTAGNTTDTAEKILRINTREANFSHTFFPLSLLTIGGKSTTISSLHPELMPTQFTTYSPTPIFYGIAPASTTVTLTLNNKTYTTTTNSNSRFGLNITDPLSSGDYPVSLFATNLQGDYVEIPTFTLRVGGTVATGSVHGITTVAPSLTPSPEPTKPTVKTISPSTSKQKSCFLWWCW